ncbi:cupin domain-containing protein [Vitiosangium sp. GDMCC 1.1324]|uniref:cupin domain-containing protein n=1 Tax=Vitiosangium sp. (strain GDMCC 1.1324) TaxID=2138576 RepID=UPI000D363570|nr:cupin domain-containing protein [Vitiosangium sp. GDMCC 1.1324]PTL75213.1 cupin [Vitiosangium sp. GDMCC 1.1324]
MSQLVIKKFAQPDERRLFVAHGHVDLIRLKGGSIGMGVFEPGWRWSTDVQPIAGTKSCQVAHTFYIVSGSMEIVMDDGSRGMLSAGDVAYIPPGHDAWVVGGEACLMVDFEGMSDYARRGESLAQQAEAQQSTPAMQ